MHIVEHLFSFITSRYIHPSQLENPCFSFKLYAKFCRRRTRLRRVPSASTVTHLSLRVSIFFAFHYAPCHRVRFDPGSLCLWSCCCALTSAIIISRLLWWWIIPCCDPRLLTLSFLVTAVAGSVGGVRYLRIFALLVYSALDYPALLSLCNS